MKILQITQYFYPSVAGIETYVRNLSEGLSKQGHEVTVIAINTMDAQKEELIDGNTYVYRCAPNIKYGKLFISFEFVRKLLKSRRYDVYHVHIPFPVGLEAAIFASKINNIPLVATDHGEGSTRKFDILYVVMSSLYKFYLWFCRFFSLRGIDKLIFYTQSYADSLAQHKIIKGKNVVIRPGVNTTRFSTANTDSNLRSYYGIKPTDKVILFVGKLSLNCRYKGVDYLIKALKFVLNSNQSAKLVIVGEGDLVSELKKLVVDLGLDQDVIFTGEITADLPKYYAMCDIFVLPSISGPESFGLVLQEAMASGKPCITTNLPGVNEVIRDGFTGILVPPMNVEALAAAILKLAGDANLRSEMALNARREMEGQTWAKFSSEIMALYQELVSK